jgi:hypothetical protein
MNTNSTASKTLSRKAILIVLGAAVVIAAAFGVRYAIIHAAEDAQQAASALATEAASTLASALGITPHVTVNGLTVIEQRTEIAELAVLQQSVFKEYSWSHTWLGSTKTLVLRGEFIAKTGLNLKEPWSLAVETSKTAQANALTLVLPPARLLSLEMKLPREQGRERLLEQRHRPRPRNRRERHASRSPCKH